MTDRNELQTIKTIAKRLARAQRIAHHEALDIVAQDLQHPHWRALTVAWDKGWRPSPSDLEKFSNLEAAARPYSLFRSADPEAEPLAKYTGEIDGHQYAIEIDFEVVMAGRGWTIVVEQAPSDSPQIEIDRRIKDNPILDSEFRARALAIANEAADELRARISADWPRRCTKPDAEGRVLHPLFGGLSSEWHCLHCDGKVKGSELANNMWHCPHCSATPIDIFSEPFWKAAS